MQYRIDAGVSSVGRAPQIYEQFVVLTQLSPRSLLPFPRKPVSSELAPR